MDGQRNQSRRIYQPYTLTIKEKVSIKIETFSFIDVFINVYSASFRTFAVSFLKSLLSFTTSPITMIEGLSI